MNINKLNRFKDTKPETKGAELLTQFIKVPLQYDYDMFLCIATHKLFRQILNEWTTTHTKEENLRWRQKFCLIEAANIKRIQKL